MGSYTCISDTMRLYLTSTLAAVASASQHASSISATCEPDNTITVAINHDINATILSASYGSCNLTSDGLSGFDAENVKSWTGSLSPSRCDMDGKLRNLKYNQTAEFTVGRSAAGKDLVFSTYNVDTYCEYQATYTINFDYGSVSAATVDFTGSGGLIGLNFFVESTNEHFNKSQTASDKAGDDIYLKLALNDTANKNFDYADNYKATSGKFFVPTKCFVSDKNSNNFTLFDVSKEECSNSVIDLAVSYDNDGHAWQFQHILFLLNNQDSSKYTLTCDILVCDLQKGSDCKDAYECLIPNVGDAGVAGPPPVGGGDDDQGIDQCTSTGNFYFYEAELAQSQDCNNFYNFQKTKAEHFGGDLCETVYKAETNDGYKFTEHCCPEEYSELEFCA